MLRQLEFISVTITSLGSVPAPVSNARHRSVVRAPKRPDIQGLRAVAVTLVLVYHFFPTAIPGGFVGVDVFFVISGFLITLLLIREIDRTGTISLSKFFVRRVRRLMPAALTTTIVTVVAAALTVGPVRLVSILQDAAWTSGYLANVHFGLDPAGYFARSDPSPFLQFWSLAVEEQYYLVWPTLLLCIVLLAKKRVLRMLPVVLTFVIVSSLPISIVLTNSGSSQAYYSLASRAWELAIGGVVAYVVFRGAWVPGRRISAAVGLLGAGGVLFAAFSFTDSTLFPGAAALIPTVGTALVIWSGTYHVGVLGRVLSVRPAQFVGDMSYSLYLWHWPVLVLGVGVLTSNSGSTRAVLMGVSLVVSIASFYLIEQRASRIGLTWHSHKVLALNIAIALTAVSVPAVAAPNVGITGGLRIAPSPVESATASIKDGTITLADHNPVIVPKSVPSNVDPSLKDLTQDLPTVFTNGCYGHTLKVCAGGDPHGKRTIVLAGDSHAGQWWPGVNQAAIENHWKLYMVGMSACALADVDVSKGGTSEPWPECRAWQREAPKAIVALHADLVIYANNTQGYAKDVNLRSNFPSTWSGGVSAVLDELRTTSKVLFFGQSPIQRTDPSTCLSQNLQDVSACSTPVDEAVPPKIKDLEPPLAREGGAAFFDPTSLLCTQVCPMMDHNVVMYRDHGHLAATYSRSLSHKLAAVISAAFPRP